MYIDILHSQPCVEYLWYVVWYVYRWYISCTVVGCTAYSSNTCMQRACVELFCTCFSPLHVHVQVLILQNHGLAALGSTVEEAFDFLVKAVEACKVQVSHTAVASGWCGGSCCDCGVHDATCTA